MTGITGILETSRKAVQYASTWTLSEVVDHIPNETCARILRSVLSGITPVADPLVCPQPITPDSRATLALRQCPELNTPHVDNPTPTNEENGNEDNLPAEQERQWALLLPVTSRGTESPQALWENMEESFDKLSDSIDAAHRDNTVVYVAFDHNDPELDTPEALERLQVLLLVTHSGHCS
jgi:hypothetical protein